MTPAGCAEAHAAAPVSALWDWPELALTKQTLPNGLRVILAENHSVPLVWLSWVARAGIACDSVEQAGLAALTPLLVREGTARRDASAISSQIDDLGADLVVGCDWDSAFVNLELLSSDLAAGADLLLDMAGAACFPELAVARVRQQRVFAATARLRQPKALAEDTLARVLYGADSAYGHAPLGTPATLQGIASATVTRFHNEHFGSSNSCLVVVGSFDSAAVIDLLGSFALPSRAAAAHRPGPASSPPSAGAALHLLDVAGSAHAEIRMGHLGVARDNADLPALQVLNAILGGGPTSRLAENLRQRRGLTYHVRSRFDARQQGGHFVVETAVASDAAALAVAGITDEIERLRQEPVELEELEQAKCRLLGADLRRLQNIIDTGGMLTPFSFAGDPAQALERRRQTIAVVAPNTLLELARRHLQPEHLLAVVVGPAQALQPQFPDNEVVPNPSLAASRS